MVCDPIKVYKQSLKDSNALLKEMGGKEKILEKGSFGATPVPKH